MRLTRTIKDLYLRLPDSIRDAVLIRRRARFWVEAGIVFIHVPKAAGTSINQALYGRFMGHVRAANIRRFAPAEVKSLPSFAVTRNPWDRLVSAYRFARSGHGVGGAIQAKVWQPQQFQVPEFESFERFVKDWLAPRDVTRLDWIFQPQTTFVCDRSRRVLVDHVGRLDDLGPTYSFVQEQIGRTLALPSSNRSGEKLDFRDFYTTELIEIVAGIYAQDIDTFGYEFD